MKNKPGFTLAELITVIGIMILLFALSLRGLVNSRQSFVFHNSVERAVQLVREARSLAVSGRAQPDYTDSDHDNSNATDPQDIVAPAHYGVYFKKSDDTSPAKITLFFDVGRGESSDQVEGKYVPPSSAGIGVFEPGMDVKLAEFELDDSLDLVLKPDKTNTIMFTPLFADTSFDAGLTTTDKFFYFEVTEKVGGAGYQGRKRCFKIHPIAGVPEVVKDLAECP